MASDEHFDGESGGPGDHPPSDAFPVVMSENIGEDTTAPTVLSAAGSAVRIVGLGGSAGSVVALQSFFAAMPPASGMAFVVVVHLSPEHDSTMAEILQRTTTMPVVQIHDLEKAEANCVYVIPPGKRLSLSDGHFLLNPLEARRGQRSTIDLFFRALADTHGSKSVAILLSGANADGANGIARIKEQGGLTIAQDPSEAEQDTMPCAGIKTGLVDWVLPVRQMPQRLLEYQQIEGRLKLPALDQVPVPRPEPGLRSASEDEKALREVLLLLQTRTGRDFSNYKRSTILRRVARRMQVNGVIDVSGYLEFLRIHPSEAQALLQDLLISVTNFFRDQECFEALEAMIPALFHGKGPADSVRAWVAACASGEEAYSVAMILAEYASTLEDPPAIQVFGTDLDEQAIQSARKGFYPETIGEDVSGERLRRFFVKDSRGFRVRRELREVVLFAHHDLLCDSPFSRCDLVCCRNLLIYLNREAQARAFQIFHFALRAGGRLFLGSSEGMDDDGAFFSVLDKKHRLYLRRNVPKPVLPVPPGPSSLALALVDPPHRDRPVARRGVSSGPVGVVPSWEGERKPGDGALSPGELHFQILERFTPPSVIVDQNYEIVHLSGHAGRFLQFSGGEITANLLRVVQPMLRVELRAALFRAVQTGGLIEALGVPVDMEGVRRVVDIRVAPATDLAPGFLLVIFATRAPAPADAQVPLREPAPVVRHLEEELEQIKNQLRETVLQNEAAVEDQKASNEELQAVNEELRSATEELETGREELQSINEELFTVNQQLKGKVEELGQANADLQNLMASTDIATIFLDRELQIKRYTPAAVTLFNLIPSDLGRPLSDLAHRLNYPELAADATSALESLSLVEREVAHVKGGTYLARMLPYRGEEQTAGVVLAFIDISGRKCAEEALRESESRFRAVADLVPDLLWSNDTSGHTTWRNQRWLEYTGQTLSQSEGFGWTDALHPQDREGARHEFQKAIAEGISLRQEYRIRGIDGVYRWFLVRAEPQKDRDGRILQWFGAAIEIEDIKAAEAALKSSEERLRLVLENAREYAIFSTDLDRRVTSWNTGAQRLLGFSEAEIMGQSADLIFTEEDRAAGGPQSEAQGVLTQGRAVDERWHLRKDGTRFWGSGVMTGIHDAQGKVTGFVKIFRDQTVQRENEEVLEKSRADLILALKETESARLEAEAAARAKDHFLAVLSHELRTPLTPILMAVQTLIRRKDQPPATLEALEMIRRNAQLEAHFIDDLLDLTRITRGTLELVRDHMDVHLALSRAIEVSAPDIEAKHQRLTVSLEATDHFMNADFARLQQAFWNLLKNAAKFTPEGGEIQVRSRNHNHGIEVQISDNGIGIDPGALLCIFDAFTQADEKITQKFGGLGLGLSIAKATVEALGGSLRAESDGLGAGSTFVVELPLT